MRVVVTLGRTKLEFKARSNRKGIVEWNQGDEVRMKPTVTFKTPACICRKLIQHLQRGEMLMLFLGTRK